MRLLRAALLFALLAPAQLASAEGRRADPAPSPPSPELRATIEALHAARMAERRRQGAVGEMARVLDRTEQLLLDVIGAAAVGDGSDEAALLEAHAARVGQLFAEVRASAPEAAAQARLAAVAQRIERLEARVAAIVAAPSPAARGELARGLLADLQVRGGSGQLRRPAPVFLGLGEDHPAVRRAMQGNEAGADGRVRPGGER
jgi:hypothetical protein